MSPALHPRTYAALCALLALLSVATPVRAQRSQTTELVIRVYDTFGFSLTETRAAEQVAAAILEPAHSRIRWRECRPRVGLRVDVTDTCADTLQPTEVVVRFVAGPPERRPARTVLGESLVDAHTGIGTLATVFADRVTTVARRVGVVRSRLLGRALAHEVGHLLLGTTEHATTGLMRADWSYGALRTGTDKDWTFSPDEAVQVARTLIARIAPTTHLAAAEALSDTAHDRDEVVP